MRLTPVGLVEALLALSAGLILLLTPPVLSHRAEPPRVERWTSAGSAKPAGEAVLTSPIVCEESAPMFQDAWLARC
jgi:hypothetical protein